MDGHEIKTALKAPDRKMDQILRKLDEANIELSKSLWVIRSCITVYSIIGLNASKIPKGKGFFGFIQHQQIDLIAVAFSRVFEQEKRFRLNSIPSIFRFIEENKINPINPQAVSDYLAQWRIEKGDSWVADVQTLLDNQYQKYKQEILRIKEARDTQIAHSQAGVPRRDLPSVAVFEALLDLAFGFHDFINSAFVNTSSHPILTDAQVQTSLVNLLREIGISDVTTEFQE
jgi:hypothetical protein